jgi:hypothetical protein
LFDAAKLHSTITAPTVFDNHQILRLIPLTRFAYATLEGGARRWLPEQGRQGCDALTMKRNDPQGRPSVTELEEATSAASVPAT